MLASKDKVLQIEIAGSPGSFVFQPCDWSIINVPTDEAEAKRVFASLYNMPNSHHITLVVCRHRRKHRMEALQNLKFLNDKFTYFETISMSYDKPSSCSNNGLLPLAEAAFLYYKGNSPSADQTGWFAREGYNNATNYWDLSVQPGQDDKHSYYQNFNWEMNLLLMSMAGRLSTRRFFYGLPVSDEEALSIYKFAKQHSLTANIVVSTQKEALDILNYIGAENDPQV